MLDYYRTWRFKHPTPNDFVRVMEHASGLELDWFKEYFVNTTHLPDYKVEEVKKDGRKNAVVVLKRVGLMPMPLDVQVTLADGSKHLFTVPLDIMRGAKSSESSANPLKVAKDWPWVNRAYELEVPFKLDEITEVEIDPSQRMIDTLREDNRWQKKS
jgi:aminopeptidase N